MQTLVNMIMMQLEMAPPPAAPASLQSTIKTMAAALSEWALSPFWHQTHKARGNLGAALLPPPHRQNGAFSAKGSLAHEPFRPGARAHSVLLDLVTQRVLPGAVALVQHQGRTVLHEADRPAAPANPNQPGMAAPAMAPDTVFRIYSMTKPIASLVALMLMEEGRLLLAHPVSAFPAFQGRQVYDPPPAPWRPPRAETTVHDLLRHGRPGLRLGHRPIADQYRNAAWVAQAQQPATGGRASPAAAPPGTCWECSRATDVLGAIIEVIEGARWWVLQRRVLSRWACGHRLQRAASSRHRLARPCPPTRSPARASP